MRTAWQSLLWKEWREHRWKVTLLIGAVALLLPWSWLYDRAPSGLEVIGPLLVMALPIVSLFVGANIASSEYADNTIGFLQSLPISPRRAAIAKLAFALITVWAPCVAMWAIGQGIRWSHPEWRPQPPVTDAVAILAASLGSIVIWMAAFGVNLGDQVRAGAIGLLAILGWIAAWGFMVEPLGFSQGLVMRLFLAPHPAGFAMPAADEAVVVCVAAMGHVALMVWYVTRFARVSRPSREPQQLASAQTVKFCELAPARRRPASAIFWKQMRETAPLAGLGAICIVLILFLIVVSLRRSQYPVSSEDLYGYLMATWMLTAFFVAIVAGIGLFIDDLKPALHEFWRAMPANPDTWFAVKFLSAGAANALVLAVPVLVHLLWISASDERSALYGAGKGPGPLTYLAWGLSAQTAAYCVAGASMALIRRPVVAAIVAAGMTTALFALWQYLMDSSPTLATAVVWGAGAVATIAAWLAVRYDWSVSS